MGRTVKGRRKDYDPRPIQRIELSDENKKQRAIAAVLFSIIGVALLVYCFVVFITPDPGWTVIETTIAETSGSDFVFRYYLGADGADVNAENRAVTALYNQTAGTIYRLLHESESYEGFVNIYDINQRVNTETEVDEALYNVFKAFVDSGSRYLYIAPIYSRYDDVFFCADDVMLVDFDPLISDEVRKEYEAVARYINDPKMIDLKLLGDNKIKLFVSDEYLSYAEKEGITDFIGMSWLKNAFQIDYIADQMVKNGFTHGSISTVDGFIRNFDSGSEYYALSIFDKNSHGVYLAASMLYKGQRSIVNMKSFPLNEAELPRYYTLKNGEIRTPYVDVEDGIPKCSIPALTAYSSEKGCGELLLKVTDIYISEDFDAEKLSELSKDSIYSVYCRDNYIVYNDSEIIFNDIYTGEDIRYELKEF